MPDGDARGPAWQSGQADIDRDAAAGQDPVLKGGREAVPEIRTGTGDHCRVLEVGKEGPDVIRGSGADADLGYGPLVRGVEDTGPGLTDGAHGCSRGVVPDGPQSVSGGPLGPFASGLQGDSGRLSAGGSGAYGGEWGFPAGTSYTSDTLIMS